MLMMPIISHGAADAAEQTDIVDSQIGQYGQTLDDLGISDTTKQISSGQFSLNPMDMLNSFGNMLFGQLKNNMGLIIQLLVLGLITALLAALQNGFGKAGVSDIAFFACYAIIAGLTIEVFMGASGDAEGFLKTGGDFINKLVPLLIILLATSGGLISSAVVSPIVMLSTELITYLITNVFLPLSFVVMTLSIANNLSEKLNINGLIGLIKNIIKWGLGILLTLFVGIIGVYSLFAPTLDSRAVAIGEYSVKTFVPVVGSILADTVGLVASCSSVVKSSVGVAGLIGFALLALVPMLKLLAQIGAVKLVGSVLEPIVDNRIVRCLNDTSGTLTLILIMLMVVALMFFVNIAIIVKMGGSSGFY